MSQVTYAHGDWTLDTPVGTFRIGADLGDVSIMPPEGVQVDASDARLLAAVLADAAEMADAQSAVRELSDAHGSRSDEAQAARARLDSLREAAHAKYPSSDSN